MGQLADFSSCAVVGSSESLLDGPGFGREIDEHTAVIRANDAPTEGAFSYTGLGTHAFEPRVPKYATYEFPNPCID